MALTPRVTEPDAPGARYLGLLPWVPASALALLLLCAIGVVPNPASAYAAESHSGGAEDRSPSIFPYLGYDVPPAAALYPLPTEQELVDPSEMLMEKKAEGISCNNFLWLEARAHNPDGTPASGAEVRFEWTSGGKTETLTKQANGMGTASTTLWIESECRDLPMLVVIWVEADDWANRDYRWFIPE